MVTSVHLYVNGPWPFRLLLLDMLCCTFIRCVFCGTYFLSPYGSYSVFANIFCMKQLRRM